MSRAETPLLIAFVDLTGFLAQSREMGDVEMADTLDAFYERVYEVVRGGGGTVVKLLGDGALIVFPEDGVDRGVGTLIALRDSVDDFLRQSGWRCRLTVRAHFGTAVAGPFGGADDKRYDVIGQAVNAAALLPSSGVTLSEAAFQRLGPPLRPRFVAGRAPGTYVLASDPL